MRLEPRVDKLEAAVSDNTSTVTRIELRGYPNGPITVAEFNGVEWTPFTLINERRRAG